MHKFKALEPLRKHLQEELLGKIPVFFNQCVVRKDDDAPTSQVVTVSAFQTDQYRIYPYHKVVSKIIRMYNKRKIVREQPS